jgi:hypothetical protein
MNVIEPAFGTLPKIAGEKKSVRPTSAKGGKEPEVGEANVLRFVHDREIEHNFIILRDHDCPRHRRD